MFGEKLINNLNELHYIILEFVAIHYSTFHSITDQNVEFIFIYENIRLSKLLIDIFSVFVTKENKFNLYLYTHSVYSHVFCILLVHQLVMKIRLNSLYKRKPLSEYKSGFTDNQAYNKIHFSIL